MSGLVHIFGVRHHGPGSARSLELALEALAPDCVLIEGPPEGDELIALAKHEGMKPPVALLVYGVEDSGQAAFYPFAEFSPEWRAIQHALRRNVPVRFMDLPLLHRFAMDRAAMPKVEQAEEGALPTAVQPGAVQETLPAGLPAGLPVEEPENPYEDPLSELASAAGYPDAESWWDHLIESRSGANPTDIFEAILEAMSSLRDSLPPRPDRYEIQREAHMRKTIRATLKEGHKKIAVVCGAWHAPVLLEERLAGHKQDTDVLKDLPKIKTAAAWVPWSYGRLSAASGYGAGITSPGYYHHLWEHRGGAGGAGRAGGAAKRSGDNSACIGWLTKVAHLMRKEDLDASSAHIIESVRLAESLAAMRDRPAPSLAELMEATRTVLLFGDSAPLALIHQKLIVSDRLGQVPQDGAVAPLQVDLQRQQKRLRLPPDPAQKTLELDLRKPNDLERSELLHRLAILGIPWGELHSSGNTGGAKGTFKEIWQTQWEPEFAVRLVEASSLGNSVYDAASAAARQAALASRDLPVVTELLDKSLHAALPETVALLLRRIDALAAIAADLLHMMNALPPLANVVRYGNVRKTQAIGGGLVEKVIETLLTRVTIGLPLACYALNDEAAEKMEQAISQTHAAVQLLFPAGSGEHPAALQDWLGSLAKLADGANIHGLLGGRATRLLLDAGYFHSEQAGNRMSLALSQGNDPAQAAAWIEGFLKGSGLILLHDQNLWAILDAWIRDLPEDRFTAVLPLLRRSFSQFPAPERHQMGQRLKSQARPGSSGRAARTADAGVDEARAAKVLPILKTILGAAAPAEATT